MNRRLLTVVFALSLCACFGTAELFGPKEEPPKEEENTGGGSGGGGADGFTQQVSELWVEQK